VIEALARVVAIEGTQVTVEAVQSSACDGCQQKDCGTGAVNQALGVKTHRMTLAYAQPVQLGDQVVLAIPERGLVIASLLVYILPLLCVILSLVVAEPLFIDAPSGELPLIIVSLMAGLAGLMLARLWSKRLQAQKMLEPELIRVLGTPVCEPIHSPDTEK